MKNKTAAIFFVYINSLAMHQPVEYDGMDGLTAQASHLALEAAAQDSQQNCPMQFLAEQAEQMLSLQSNKQDSQAAQVDKSMQVSTQALCVICNKPFSEVQGHFAVCGCGQGHFACLGGNCKRCAARSTPAWPDLINLNSQGPAGQMQQ